VLTQFKAAQESCTHLPQIASRVKLAPLSSAFVCLLDMISYLDNDGS
jgi:hypothetical protein